MWQTNPTPADASQHWYIAYTLPRHEKAIAQRFQGTEISCYVPLYAETRIWRERKVNVDLPLFPSYVFVRMHLERKGRLLSAPGVVRLLTGGEGAVVFPDEEMEALQSSLKTWSAEPFPFHNSGKRVRVRSGPFAGLQGTILRRNGKSKLIVTLDHIQSSMLLDVDISEIQLDS